MTYAEKLVNICTDLTEDEQKQIVDFAEFLKNKKEKELEQIMDNSILKNMVALKELAK
ncbi:hypothetical protein UT300009_30540 [Paraclostridium bifermentans]